MDNRNQPIRLALIGCGAIAQSHAQAIATMSGVNCGAVFDINRERAEAFRLTSCPDAQVVDDLRGVAEHADAAIVAVPNAQHARVSMELLRAGLHVLCEKPLAISSTEAREMIAVAEEHQRTLTCGLLRRFYNSTNLVSAALSRNLLGQPLSFEVRESVWNWPLNRMVFDPAIAGGGVLIDIGPHVFDLLSLWFGSVELLEYRDDKRGGVEAFADARLRCGGEVRGRVQLTRAYGTINRTRILCERGYIDFNPHERDSIALVFTDGAEPFTTIATATPHNPFVKQLENFLGALAGETKPLAPATAALPTVSLIETCYQNRQPLVERWSAPEGKTLVPNHPYKKILVTGASGSVGSRMIEMWAAEGRLDELRCMVRSYRSAARIMRYPVEVKECDLVDKEAVRRAAEGCDAIVHLGVGEKASRETQPLIDVALELGIRRFVHMSTAAVYGQSLPAKVEELQERTKVVKTDEPYADEKALAERAVVRACRRGLEAIILRPHMVYGPGLRWSGELMELLAQDRICVLEDGGWCNLIYVDDLVRAVSRALIADEGFGEPLFITDGAPLKWSEYIDAHAALIGTEPVRVRRAEVLRGKLGVRGWMRESVKPIPAILKSQEFRRFVFESPLMQATLFRAYLMMRGSARFQPLIEKLRSGGGGGATIHSGSNRRECHQLWTELQISEARLKSERAAELIGFRAEIDFREGLRRSALWFEQFGLLPARPETSEPAQPSAVLSTIS